MAHEAVPADIAAAIIAFGSARAMLSAADANGSELTKYYASEGLRRARATLDAAILTYLRGDPASLEPFERAKAAYPHVPDADLRNPGGMIRIEQGA